MGTTLPKPVKICKGCKAIYVDDDLFRGKCPKCGKKQ